MLKDFSWDMTGYIPKYNMEPSANGLSEYLAERIFQLEPEPPKVDSINEYILSALREKNLIYFSFFLHHYELQLNKRIKSFLGVDGRDPYNTERFLDIKLSCREQMLQKLPDYDGEWGEISFDFENGTAKIVRLADWDTVKINRFANIAIQHMLSLPSKELTRSIFILLE